MALPAEIRLHILKDLLWQEEPLRITEEASYEHLCPCSGCRTQGLQPQPKHRQSTFHFSPAILRTSRALHEEGHNILYNNVFACDLWYNTTGLEDEDIYASSFLRPDWNLNHSHLRLGDGSMRFYLSSFLLIHVKRLDVVARVTEDEGCSVTRQIVKYFVQGTRKFPQLAHLNIRVELSLPTTSSRPVDEQVWRYENGTISQEDYQDQALGPFAIMRGLKSVKVAGTSDEVASELTALMTGNLPVVDLGRMYELLSDYVQKNREYRHCEICSRAIGYLERAEHAADMEDERAFKKARSNIFALVADHQKQERVRACQNDPNADPEILSGNCKETLPEFERGPDYDGDDRLRASKCTWWRESMQLEWERRNEETETDRLRRQAEEQQRPSLIRLREIVQWERDESPFSAG